MRVYVVFFLAERELIYRPLFNMFTYTCAESVTAQARALTTETSAKKRSLVKIKAKAEEEGEVIFSNM